MPEYEENKVVSQAQYEALQYTYNRPRKIFYGTSNYDEDRITGSTGRNELRQLATDGYRNNGTVRAVVDRFVSNVIGSGIHPQSKTSNPETNIAYENHWKYFHDNCDFTGRSNLTEILRQVVASRFLAGEHFIALLSNGKIQSIEQSRIVTPDYLTDNLNVIDGIEVDAYGKVKGYHVGNRGEDGLVSTEDTRFISSRNMIHICHRWRTEQIHGIPELAPILNLIDDHKDLNDATLTKARTEAYQAYKVKVENPSSLQQGLMDRNSAQGETEQDEEDQIITDVSPNSVTYLKPNEDIEPIASVTPSSGFNEYERRLVEQIGSALGLPAQVIMMNFDSNFSSSRTAIMQSYQTIEIWQKWLIDNLLQRLYNWQIAHAIKKGIIPNAPISDLGISEWYKCDWATPAKQWVDPVKEINSMQTAYNMGTVTLADITRSKGKDIEDQLRQKGLEIAHAIRIANEINEETGSNLTYHDLINPPSGATWLGEEGNSETEKE